MKKPSRVNIRDIRQREAKHNVSALHIPPAVYFTFFNNNHSLFINLQLKSLQELACPYSTRHYHADRDRRATSKTLEHTYRVCLIIIRMQTRTSCLYEVSIAKLCQCEVLQVKSNDHEYKKRPAQQSVHTFIYLLQLTQVPLTIKH